MHLTKAQQNSVTRLRTAIETIEQLVPIERKRSSRQRRKSLEQAHGVLRMHGYKLGFTVPSLSHFYDEEQFLAHAHLVADQLQRMQADVIAISPTS